MKFRRTEDFVESFNALPSQLQSRAEKTLEQLAVNPRYPSLRLEKLRGTSNSWSVRVNRKIRITLQFISDDEVVLIDIGGHEIYR
jgi:plasmid maintenance system killer protein